MARRSRGKYAWAIDDRTGRKVLHRETRREWNGQRVHKSEWEPKHPQLTPPRISPDATSVRDPRPDNDPTNATVNYLGHAHYGPGARSWIGQQTIQLDPALSGEALTPHVSSVTIDIGHVIFVTGQDSATGQGEETIQLDPVITGQGLGSAIGIGSIYRAEEGINGQAAASALGSVSVVLPGYGDGTYGSGTWGN